MPCLVAIVVSKRHDRPLVVPGSRDQELIHALRMSVNGAIPTSDESSATTLPDSCSRLVLMILPGALLSKKENSLRIPIAPQQKPNKICGLYSTPLQ